MASAISSSPPSGSLDSKLDLLCDAFRLQGHLFHLLTKSRKAFIEPGVEKNIRFVLQEAKPSSGLLFGSDLPEKIKSARAIGKIGASLLKPQQSSGYQKKASSAYYKTSSFGPRPYKDRFRYRNKQKGSTPHKNDESP